MCARKPPPARELSSAQPRIVDRGIQRASAILLKANVTQSTHHRQPFVLATAVLAAICLAGCGLQSAAVGTADRSFTVSGPVHVELTNGSGDCRVTAGPSGEVRIHAQFHVRAWPWENAQRRLSEIESNPPISQEANLIRIGSSGWVMQNISVDYTVTVPADSAMHGVSGSGDTEVAGISGPVNFTVGSGSISATNIADDTRTIVGSGNVTLTNMQGQLDVTTGSGDLAIVRPRGEVHLRAGSGDIRIEKPGSDVEAVGASGDIAVTDPGGDLRLRTGSGDISVNGNPGPESDWDIRAGSGDVKLQLPSSASFRFYGRSRSGDINVAIPAVTEGDAGKHEMRARIGDGKARVEVQTSSGDISIH